MPVNTFSVNSNAVAAVPGSGSGGLNRTSDAVVANYPLTKTSNAQVGKSLGYTSNALIGPTVTFFALRSDAVIQLPVPVPVPPPNQPVCNFTVNARGYVVRLTLPQPQDQCNGMTGRPAREFYECQFQIAWTGHCVLRKFFTHTKLQTVPMEGRCPPQVTCITFPFCDDNLFTYDSHP